MGNENVGSIEYDARINTKNVKADAKQVERIAKDAGDSLDKNVGQGSHKAESALKGLGLRLVGVAASLTAVVGVSKLLSGALTDLSGLQTARSSFEVLTGSAEKASKVMGDIAAFANTTPFEFPEIAKAARTLLGFGVVAEDVQKNIERIGDAAAASGGSVEAVSVVFGQIFAAGKLNAQDFLQLINNGIALGPEISKQLGIPMSDLKDNIEKGKVTFDVFNKALSSATGEGGKYFQATSKLALTLNGRLSTLSDTFTGFIGKVVGVDFSSGIVDANGAFAKFSDLVKSTTDTLGSDGFQGQVDKVLKDLRDFIGTVKEIATAVYKFLQPAIEGLGNAISQDLVSAANTFVRSEFVRLVGGALVVAVYGAVRAIEAVVRVIASFVSQVSTMTPLLIAATAGFVGYQAVIFLTQARVAALTLAQTALNAAMRLNPIALVTGLAVGLVAAYINIVSQSDRSAVATDRLKAAQDALTHSTNAAKDAQDRLKGALLSEEGAALAVERAQLSYNEAVAQYGPTSLQAREAAYGLKRANDDLAQANANVRDRTNEAKKAEEDKNKAFNEVVRANDAVAASANRAAGGYAALADSINRARAEDKKTGIAGIGKNEGDAIFKVPGRASGGSVSANSPYFVGENRDGSLNNTSELFVPRTAGTIVNSKTLQDALGGGRGGTNIENNIANVNISSDADGERWLKRLTQNQEIIGKGLTPQQSY